MLLTMVYSPLTLPGLFFPQDSEDLLPRSAHPVKHQMFQKNLPTLRGHEGVRLMLPLAGITAAIPDQSCDPQDTKVSKCTNKRHILCLHSHPRSHTQQHFQCKLRLDQLLELMRQRNEGDALKTNIWNINIYHVKPFKLIS